jgi:hypothetical protein
MASLISVIAEGGGFFKLIVVSDLTFDIAVCE